MAKAITNLASRIAKREGKKHQASIGDIREILKIMAHLEAESMDLIGGKTIKLGTVTEAILEEARKIFAKKASKK